MHMRRERKREREAEMSGDTEEVGWVVCVKT